jgi:multiple sugar transport system substrate-binding protein/putative spermidine/putrescine transport system substrate-binding protein
VPFHRNQTVIAFNAAEVANPPTELPAIFDYVKANNLKIAVTNPTKGGSGSGFIESALLALAPECKSDLYNFALSEDEAKAAAARCMPKVVQFFRDRRDVIEFTNGNENSIQEIANGVVAFATVWEDDLYTLAAKGMVPKTVKPLLLASGEVGDGDGLFVVASTDKLEAALVYANFLMSDQVQIDKLEQTGSRTARLDLATLGKIPEKLATYLVPDAAYRQATRPRINGLISDAAADIFVQQVIAAQ